MLYKHNNQVTNNHKQVRSGGLRLIRKLNWTLCFSLGPSRTCAVEFENPSRRKDSQGASTRERGMKEGVKEVFQEGGCERIHAELRTLPPKAAGHPSTASQGTRSQAFKAIRTPRNFLPGRRFPRRKRTTNACFCSADWGDPLSAQGVRMTSLFNQRQDSSAVMQRRLAYLRASSLSILQHICSSLM